MLERLYVMTEYFMSQHSVAKDGKIFCCNRVVLGCDRVG